MMMMMDDKACALCKQKSRSQSVNQSVNTCHA